MIRDVLAAYAHEAWAGWMEYLFSKSEFNADGTVTIPAWAVSRWQRQMRAQFANLPGTEQQLDYVEADRILSIMGKGVSANGEPTGE